MLRPMYFERDRLILLDQRLLPNEETWLTLETLEQVIAAIKEMAVRGAPAIGIAGAFGLALACKQGLERSESERDLLASRPTAVNLANAIERMKLVPWKFDALLSEAKQIEADDLQMNLTMAEFGNQLVPQSGGILTICNTGAIATAGHGTALGVIRSAHQAGKQIHVYSCETRPRMQGLKLTAWELLKEGIPFKSIVDSAAAALLASRKVSIVLAGADRIASNGDTANKIGTLSLAVLASHFNVPFVIVAPSSTLDTAMQSGAEIEIEERDAKEISHDRAGSVAAEGVQVWNPAFDVTPGSLISHIVTEKGIFSPPYRFGP